MPGEEKELGAGRGVSGGAYERQGRAAKSQIKQISFAVLKFKLKALPLKRVFPVDTSNWWRSFGVAAHGGVCGCVGGCVGGGGSLVISGKSGGTSCAKEFVKLSYCDKFKSQFH